MKVTAVLGTVVLAAAVAGCGGSSDQAANSGAAGSVQIKRLLEQTFGPNAKASSGLLSGTIDIDVKGVPRFEQPISLSMSGPFRQQAGADPEANLSLGIGLRDKIYGADMILLDDQVLIGLGSTAYGVPDTITTTIRKPLADSDNGLGAVLDVFAIAPERWVKDVRIVGSDRVAGIDVVHATANIDADRFFVDVARFARVLTSLRFTEIAGLPEVIGPKLRAALVRSVTSATGDAYTGAEDHVVRKARVVIKLKPAAADRKLLAGITAMKITATLTVSDVGAPQTITPPKNRGSYPALQLTLDALGEAVRRDEREAKR